MSEAATGVKQKDRFLANLPGLSGKTLASLYIAAAALPLLAVLMAKPSR